VQIGQDQLNGGHLEFWMHIDRDAAAIIFDGNGPINMHGHFNFAAVAGEVFVDRVIENFKDHVVQTTFVRVTDVHSGAFPDRFEAFQLIDLGGVIFLRVPDASGVCLAFLSV
jgi:hypothetical protein